MAHKITVAVEDDLDGSPADETVRFGFEGAEYEIDLSTTNARRLRAQLAPFIDHARKAGRGLARRPARTAAGRQRSGGRLWANFLLIHGVRRRGAAPLTVAGPKWRVGEN